MPGFKLEQFGGMLPAWDQRLLPPGQAARSLNGYMFSGALKGWRKPKVLRALTNPAAKMAYRLPTLEERQAKAYLVFKSQPAAGDTLVIGDNEYVFRTTITSTNPPGEVLIGPTVTDTVTNLIAAITADNGASTNAGTWYSLNTIANTNIKWYKTDQDVANGLPGPSSNTANIAGTNYTFMFVGSEDFGAAYNSIVVAESTNDVRMTWLQDLLGFADTTGTLKGGTNATFTNDITGAATWLEFEDPDTNVLKSQVVDDKWERYYTASPAQPPKYNTKERILDGLPFWLLGVPPPGCAPILEVTGGGNDLQLGRPQQSGNSFTGPSNAILLIPVKPPGDTLLQNLKFRTFASLTGDGRAAATDQDGDFAAVVYTDDQSGGIDTPGKPQTLIATGQVVTGINKTQDIDNVSAFVNPVALQADTYYWIGFMVDTQIEFSAGFGSLFEMDGFLNVFANGPAELAASSVRTSSTWPADTVQGQLITGLPTLQFWGDGQTTDVIEARSYVYTWVSAYNEEGPPSPASLLNGWSNGSWSVGLWTPPPNDRGVLRNLTSINIYRTVTSSAGIATFFKVANVPMGTASYTDTATNREVALNDQLPSTNWFPPPENLQGIITMPNGVFAGFANNQIWFCDPYHPHAWPPGFVLTTEFPIVGLGLTNGALVVCTSTNPYVVTGSSPGQMALTKCSRPNPCSSRGSIVSGDDFVSYHSRNGLIQVSPTGAAINTTDLWFTREQWTQLTPQKYVRAVHLASCYFAYGTTSPPLVSPADNSVAQTGFTIELDEDNKSFTIWPHPGGHRLGFNELDSHTGFNIDNVLVDPWTGVGMLISNGSVYYYDFSDANPELTTYVWKSKIYQHNAKRSFGAMKVFFTIPDTHDTLNEFRLEVAASDSEWATLPDDRYGFIKTYVDYDGTGQLTLIDCREIRASGELLRIISGFKAEQWQWEITANVEISNVQIASTAKELANV